MPLYSLAMSLLTFMGRRRKRLISSVLAAFISISFLLASCGRKPTSFTPDERTTRYIGFVVLGLMLLIVVGALLVVLYTNRLRRRNHQALKRMSALRENFFANITHEFRTPLTVILGMSRDLQRFDAEEVKGKAQSIQQQGEGLLTLINQLLGISKIKSAVGDADWKNGNIMAYLTMIVESYRDYARSRNSRMLSNASLPRYRMSYTSSLTAERK